MQDCALWFDIVKIHSRLQKVRTHHYSTSTLLHNQSNYCLFFWAGRTRREAQLIIFTAKDKLKTASVPWQPTEELPFLWEILKPQYFYHPIRCNIVKHRFQVFFIKTFIRYFSASSAIHNIIHGWKMKVLYTNPGNTLEENTLPVVFIAIPSWSREETSVCNCE